MPDGEYQKLNAQKINGVTSTDAKIPITIIIRNEGLRALDGIDLLVPTPFAKDLWVALQRRGVRASGLRDEFAAHLESKTLCFPIDDVESEAGRLSEKLMREELMEKYLGKPHNRRCKFWSALSVKLPFEFQWDQLAEQWNVSDKVSENGAFVCRDLRKLRKIKEALKNEKAEVEEVLRSEADGMLIPVKLEFVGRGRPKRFGMICLPTPDDLISIRRNRNKEIIQQPRLFGTSSEEPMEIQEELKPLQGFVSLDAAASEKPISLKWLFEESSRLDDTISKRKRANRKKKESRKRRKLTFEQRKTDEQVEEAERHSAQYRFSADREIIGRLVAGEQSVLGGRGVALGYICADALPLISSNYHKSKTVVMVRNSTSKYYHAAYVSILINAVQI
uniref:POPLD domain-containing protein n=1 Tax=Caenorhabditis japonica TaxID=281687 RepID=A0A8R1DYX3_CAEJA